MPKKSVNRKALQSSHAGIQPGRPRQGGTLVIIGGHEDKDNECVILKEIAKILHGGKLVVSTVASEEPEEYFKTYKDAFGKIGVKNFAELDVADRQESSDEKKLKALDKAAGVFFTGGDQLKISSQIGDTAFESKVKEIFENGGVIAGTSAGASAMASVMLVSGSSEESYKIGDLHLAPGLGLLPDTIIDQHFAERGRIGRLMGAISMNPRFLGIGIDEDTAIVVRNGQFSVIGSGAVYIVDAANATHSNIAEAETDSILSIYGVTLHMLSAGETFNLADRRPTFNHGG